MRFAIVYREALVARVVASAGVYREPQRRRIPRPEAPEPPLRAWPALTSESPSCVPALKTWRVCSVCSFSYASRTRRARQRLSRWVRASPSMDIPPNKYHSSSHPAHACVLVFLVARQRRA